MHGHVVALRNHVTTIVKNGARIVPAFFDVRRESRPLQSRSHFFCDRMKQAYKNFKLDGVRLHTCSKTKFKYSSTTHRSLGSTSVVELYSPMIAGPLITWP